MIHGVETPIPFPSPLWPIPIPVPSPAQPRPIPSQGIILWNQVQGIGMGSVWAREGMGRGKEGDGN